MNQGAQFVRHLENMIVLARVIAQGARNRDESRGAHFKPEFPQRDDANWLRTTLAFHEGAANGTPDRVRYVRELDYALLGKTVHVTDAVDVEPREAARRASTSRPAPRAPPPPGVKRVGPRAPAEGRQPRRRR